VSGRNSSTIKTGAVRTGAGLGGPSAGGAGGAGMSGRGGNSRYNTTRYNPVYDRLDEGTVVEEWIPRDPVGLNRLFRLIYLRDQIGGPAVDLFAKLPWSDYYLSGIDDPKIMQLYEDALDALRIREQLVPFSTEFLMLGKVCASLVFDESLGYWTDFIFHDPDFLKIRPITYGQYDPLIDLRVSPAMRRFVEEQDPRTKPILETINPKFLAKLRQGGFIPLDPLNTIYLPRRVNPYDMVGTSIYTRMLTLWAFEKAIINASVIGARRRAGGIVHVRVGTEQWEASEMEMENVAGLFHQADEDPVGAVVVTRNGVEPTRLESNQGMWKISDEWSYLAEAKMKALGINEMFLQGDASYATLDVTLSVFLERVRSHREFITQRIIVNKLCGTLARLHGFVKRSKAELSHNIRIGGGAKHLRGPVFQPKQTTGNSSYMRGGQDNIPLNMLHLPSVYWTKQLKPIADENYLNILTTLKEDGIPITLRAWAAGGGFDLDAEVRGLDEDVKMRKKLEGWEAATGGGEEGGGSYASFKGGYYNSDADNDKLMEDPSELSALWDGQGNFMQLKLHEARRLVDRLHRSSIKTASKDDFDKWLYKQVGDKQKMNVAKYLLLRMGKVHANFTLPENFLQEVVGWIYNNCGQVTKETLSELYFIHRISKKDEQKVDIGNIVRPDRKRDNLSSEQFLTGNTDDPAW